MSDRLGPRALGLGPAYRTSDVSPSRCLPYYVLAAEHASYFESLRGLGLEAAAAIARPGIAEALDAIDGSREAALLPDPTQLVLGKSRDGAGPLTDAFAAPVGPRPPAAGGGPGRTGARALTAATPPAPGPSAETPLELGGRWAVYREFWRRHGLEHLARLAAPEVGDLRPGGALEVPLLVRNPARIEQSVRVRSVLPEGWWDEDAELRADLGPLATAPLRARLRAPAREGEYLLRLVAEVDGRALGEVTLRARVEAAATGD
jgi:hypothetical protein